VAPFAVASGYARASQDYMLALLQAGVSLEVQPMVDANSDNLEPRYAGLLELIGTQLNPTHVVIQTIPRFASEFVKDDLDPGPHVKKVVVTTWETDKLPRSDAEALDKHFDLVLVPSNFNRDVFVAAGVPSKKVEILPHCFDPQFWWPEAPPIPPDFPFTFTWVGVWSERKNPIGLLKAYLSAFTANDKVLLKILCPYVLDDDVLHLAKCSGLPNPPQVEFVRSRLDEIALRNFHYTSHCYVTLSRGEGWNLGAFEAAICGNPVISSDFGGQRDFLKYHLTTAYVNCFLTPVITPEVKAGEPISIGGVKFIPMKRAVPTGITGEQFWAEPNLFQAGQFMRHVYENREVCKRTKQSRALFEEKFSYDVVGRSFRSLLEAM